MYTADRDYETALMYLHDHVTTAGEVPLWTSNFYLYLLAKNGMSERTAQIVAQLAKSQEPDVHRFLDWYSRKFDTSVARLSD